MCIPESDVGIGEAGLQFYRDQTFCDGVIDFTFFEKCVSEICMRICQAEGMPRLSGVRFNRYALLIIRDGLVQLSTLFEKRSEIVLGHLIVGSHGKHMLPKRFAIAPIRNFRMCFPG